MGSSAKFIIASNPRSGSHMLASALNSHSQLSVIGEAIYRPERYGIESQEWQAILRSIYKNHNGFVQHRRGVAPGQRNFRWREFWQYLIKDQQILVLNLKRNNYLQMAVSYELAAKTSVWHRQATGGNGSIVDAGQDDWCIAEGAEFENPSITIDPLSLINKIEEWQQAEAFVESLVAPDRRREVTYEDLTRDLASALSPIWPFLGLSPESVSVETCKVTMSPIQSVVKNFQEVEQAILHSKYAHLLNFVSG